MKTLKHLAQLTVIGAFAMNLAIWPRPIAWAAAMPPAQGSFSMESYLALMGRKHSRFFTLEMISGTEKNTIQMTMLHEPNDSEDCLSALERLRSTVTYFSYEVDSANPRIIHVVDSRLRSRKGYALDVQVRSLSFLGTVDKLGDKLAAMGIPVAYPHLSWIGQGRDFSTTVRVDARNRSVRSVLTDFLPLEKRTGGLLWVATAGSEDRAITDIRYP